MNKSFFAICLLLLVSSSGAQELSAEIDFTNPEAVYHNGPMAMDENLLDPSPVMAGTFSEVCIYRNDSYSKGAIARTDIGLMICDTSQTSLVVGDNRANATDLRWLPFKPE